VPSVPPDGAVVTTPYVAGFVPLKKEPLGFTSTFGAALTVLVLVVADKPPPAKVTPLDYPPPTIGM